MHKQKFSEKWVFTRFDRITAWRLKHQESEYEVNGKRRKVWWLLAIVVLGLAVWGWRILNAPLPQYQTLVVRKGDLSRACWPPASWMPCEKLTSGRRSADS
jgi:hypothetical protein